MPRKRQSNPELEQRLREQLGFIAASSKSYDDGTDGEARRIAVSLRLLCHQTTKSHALLSQLGLLSRVKFLATGMRIDKRNLMPQAPLTMMSVGSGGASYRPMLDERIARPRWIPFDKWWRLKIIRDGKSVEFSRKELVLEIENRDGGAHVDPSLDEAYHRLSRENSMGWLFLREGASPQSSPFEAGPELATVRQIGHEFYLSLAKYRPEFI